MFFHDLVAALDGGLILEHTALQRLDITIDECQWRAQFMRGVGDKVLPDLLGHGLLGDVVHHEPGAAFSLGRQRRGLDEVMPARQVRGVGKLNLAHDAPLLLQRTLDDIGDLVVLQLLNQRAAAMDAALLKKMRQGSVDEFDAQLVIDDGDSLTDLVKQGLKQAPQVLFLDQRMAGLLQAVKACGELVGLKGFESC